MVLVVGIVAFLAGRSAASVLFGYPDGVLHSESANLTSSECGNIRERLWIVDRVSIRLMPKHNEQAH